MAATEAAVMDKIVSLCKRRGFVFQSSEIYGGLGSVWDYGPLGVELKKNIKERWWRAMVQARDDIEGLDAAILMHPRVWDASGHVAGFTDPLVDCRTCKARFRADKIQESNCPQKPSKRPGEHTTCDLTEPRLFNLMHYGRDRAACAIGFALLASAAVLAAALAPLFARREEDA